MEGDQSLLLIVDPNGTIEEADNLNNRVTVALTGTGGGPPTQDPLAPTEPPPAQ